MIERLNKATVIDWVWPVYFIGMLLLSFSLYKERLMEDSTFMIFDMISYGGLPGLQNRFVIVLTEIFPLLAIKLGLPFKDVIMSYIVNEWFFYFVIFLLLRFWLKDKWATWLMLILYTSTIASNYYLIVISFPLGASLIVLFISIIRNRQLDKMTAYIIAILLFFISFSHPVVSIAFIITCGFYLFYFWVKGKTVLIRVIKSHNKVIVMVVVFFLIRFVMAATNHYEQQMGADFNFEKFNSVLLLFTLPVILDLAKMYLLGFTVVSVAFAMVLYKFINSKQYLISLTFVFICFSYIVFIAFYADISNMHRFTIGCEPVCRWIFPLNFLILLVFFKEVLLPYWLENKKRFWAVKLMLIAFLFANVYIIEHLSLRPRIAVIQYDYLIEKAEKVEGSKFYVKLEEHEKFAYSHPGIFADYIVFSLLRESKPTKQIAIARDFEIKFLQSYPEDSLYLNDGNAFKIEELNNRNYFRIKTGS